MHDIGARFANDFHRLKKIAQAAQWTETAALALDRNHRKTFGLEPLAVLAHARRDRDLQAAIPRRLRHRQEMRDKEPVFGDEVKDFGHDRRHCDPSSFCRPLAAPNRGRPLQHVLYASPKTRQSRRRPIGQRMTANSKIALHHVGGRWGNHPFPRLPAFAGDFVEVLYEADTDAIAAIHEAGKSHANELIVIPACLADSDGEGLLHIYLNPGLTSLHEINRVLDRRYQNTFGIDFDFGNDGARL